MNREDFLNRTFRHWSMWPCLGFLLALSVYPVVQLVPMALSTIQLSSEGASWAFTPRRNLELLLGDEVLRDAIVNTLVFVVLSVAIEMVLGFFSALFIACLPRGRTLARTIMILPILLPAVAIGSMWKLMYNFDFGLFNQIAAVLGLDPINWLGDKRLALLSVIIVDIWHWTPFVFLILFAAIETLPQDVLEGRPRRWRHILADDPADHPAAAGAGAGGRGAVPCHRRVQGIRSGVPADVRRAGHGDRAPQPASEPRVLRAEPTRLRLDAVARHHRGDRGVARRQPLDGYAHRAARPRGGGPMIPFGGRVAWIGYLVVALAILFILGPTAWIFMNSIKYQIAIFTGAWVFEPTLDNYVEVLFSRRSDLVHNLLNSFVVAALSTFVVLVVGSLGAYGLHRWYKGRLFARLLLGWVLVFHMIPVLTLVGPWYLLFQSLGLYNSLSALVLTHITINLPMTMWIMLTYFNEVPVELREAATIDGCGDFTTFRRIILPLVGPGLVSAGILSFVFSWNEFAIALNLTARDTATVPVAIARFAQQFEIQHAQMAASSMIAIVPALLLMAFGQRFVVRGLTTGAVK